MPVAARAFDDPGAGLDRGERSPTVVVTRSSPDRDLAAHPAGEAAS